MSGITEVIETLGRVRRITLAEAACRSRQAASKWVDCMASAVASSRVGQAHTGGRGWRSGRGRRTPDPGVVRQAERLGDAFRSRFFSGASADAAEAFATRLADIRREIVDAANAICDRRIDLLGYNGLQFDRRVDWHFEPVVRRRAPLIHWSRIDPLDAATVGDCKVTWELNRHQWLVTVAQAYRLTGDLRYAREVMDVMADWARDNPYGVGLNWASSLEVAMRLMAWCWALALVLDRGPAISVDELEPVVSLIWMHAAHVERYLSYFFSPNTHLTGEALGLYYAGVLFQEFRDATRWRTLGHRILVAESARQVTADGVYVEQATCYQRYSIEIYLHFLMLARQNGLGVPVEVRARTERMLEFLLFVRCPDGTMPAIGDADGGWLLPLTRRAPNDCRGVFALGAVLFSRSDFAWAAGGFAPEVAWCLGPEGVRAMDALPAAPPPDAPSRVFEAGGYAVMRSDWRPDAHHLVMDIGPLGCRTSGAHGHADLLSVQCAVFGHPCLVDPGTYCYTSDAEWRDYFRSTQAHSTVTIDGRSQATPTGPFRWHTRPEARLRDWQFTPDLEVVDAEHNAYAVEGDPVTHRRRVIFVKPRYWVIVDDLSGGGAHDVELRFQFGMGQVVRLGAGLWAAASSHGRGGLWMAPFTTAALRATVREGRVDPIEGWVAPDYGQRHSAPAVVYTAINAVRLRVMTLLWPVEVIGSEPPDIRRLLDAGGALVGLRLVDLAHTVRVEPAVVVTRR